MHYQPQKAMQRELNKRIPPRHKGDPQNEFRNVVHSHRLRGETFDEASPKP